MFIYILLLIVGFILLIKGADYFVEGASSLAANFKVPKIIIGLTIVAFGTSAPELAVSIKATLSNNSDIVLGNVIGSNILNILLILGLSCLIKPIKVKDNTVFKEIPITILISTLLMVLCFDNMFDKNAINMISRTDGLVILLFFSIFIYYLFSSLKENKNKKEVDTPKFSLLISIVLSLLGLAGIIFGSNFVVENASNIAKELGVSDKMIALTIVAFGTSLPELVTSIVAAKKGENDIAIGNVIGSNIFNIGMVVGIPALFINNINATGFGYVDMVTMLLAAILLFVFSRRKKEITQLHGAIMFVLFIIYYSYILLGGN